MLYSGRDSVQFDALLLNTADLVAAMHEDVVFQLVWQFFIQFIHAHNPRFLIYLTSQYGKYRRWHEMDLLYTSRKTRNRHLRNRHGFRALMAELVLVAACSPKIAARAVALHTCTERDLDMREMRNYMRAPDTRFAATLFHLAGVEESSYYRLFFVAINEFAFAVAHELAELACRWLQWMFDYHHLIVLKQDTTVKKRLLDSEQTAALLKWLRQHAASVEVSDQSVRTNHITWLLWVYLYWIDEARALLPAEQPHAEVRRAVLYAAFQFHCWHHDHKTIRLDAAGFAFLVSMYLQPTTALVTPQFDRPLVTPQQHRVIDEICQTDHVHVPYMHVRAFREHRFAALQLQQQPHHPG